METKQKEVYIASTLFAIFGLFLIITGFDSGGWSSQKITILFGVILGSLGIAGFVKPSIGEVILHWMKNVGKNQENNSYRQHQHKPKNSPQTHAGRDVNIVYANNHRDQPKKIRDFNLLKHIYDNRKRKGFFTSKELSQIVNKDLEETNESLRYFQEKGWVSLGNTDEQASFAIILKASGLDIVEENNG